MLHEGDNCFSSLGSYSPGLFVSEDFSFGQGQGVEGSGWCHSTLGLLGLHEARCPVSLASSQYFLSVLLPQVQDQA